MDLAKFEAVDPVTIVDSRPVPDLSHPHDLARRRIGNAVVRGPSEIEVEVDGNRVSFELGFRFVVRIPMDSLRSWSVYEMLPEDAAVTGLFVRTATFWMDQPGLERSDVANAPRVSARSKLVSASESVEVDASLLAVNDALTRSHFEPQPQWTPGDPWQENDLYRLLDWGCVDVAWTSAMRNDAWETSTCEAARQISRAIESGNGEMVQRVSLRYYDTPYGYLNRGL